VQRVSSWLRLIRFREWYYFLVLPLAGTDPSEERARAALCFARGAAIAFCVLAFGYLVNAASDVGVDVDVRKNPLLETDRRRLVPSVTVSLAVTAILLAASGPLVALLAALVSLVSGVVYSIGPRLKAVPIAGTLANATNFVPLLWVGATSADPPLARHLAPAFAGLLLQSQIFHEAADAEGDANAGLRTTFLALGRGWSVALATLFGVLPAMGIGWTVGRLGIVVTYGVAFPLALAVYARDPARAARLRTWHRVSGLAVGAALFLHDA